MRITIWVYVIIQIISLCPEPGKVTLIFSYVRHVQIIKHRYHRYFSSSARSSAEHRAIEKEMGFGYRQVLGELSHASYVVGRMNIRYPVTLLARYASAPG